MYHISKDGHWLCTNDKFLKHNKNKDRYGVVQWDKIDLPSFKKDNFANCCTECTIAYQRIKNEEYKNSPEYIHEQLASIQIENNEP